MSGKALLSHDSHHSCVTAVTQVTSVIAASHAHPGSPYHNFCMKYSRKYECTGQRTDCLHVRMCLRYKHCGQWRSICSWRNCMCWAPIAWTMALDRAWTSSCRLPAPPLTPSCTMSSCRFIIAHCRQSVPCLLLAIVHHLLQLGNKPARACQY